MPRILAASCELAAWIDSWYTDSYGLLIHATGCFADFFPVNILDFFTTYFNKLFRSH